VITRSELDELAGGIAAALDSVSARHSASAPA
jgi:hypothetical protein